MFTADHVIRMGEDTNASRLKERDRVHNLSVYWGIILKWS